jgi:hypothetical protein
VTGKSPDDPKRQKLLQKRTKQTKTRHFSSLPSLPSVQLPAGAEAQWLFLPEPDTRNLVSIRNLT